MAFIKVVVLIGDQEADGLSFEANVPPDSKLVKALLQAIEDFSSGRRSR